MSKGAITLALWSIYPIDGDQAIDILALCRRSGMRSQACLCSTTVVAPYFDGIPVHYPKDFSI